MKKLKNLKNTVVAISFLTLIGTSANAGTDIVADGGFEAGYPNADWTPTSTFTGLEGFPFCGPTCPAAGVGNGDWSIWIGGLADITSSVEQTITIPSGSGDLSLWILRGVCDATTDVLHISLDATDIGTLACDGTDAELVQHMFPVGAFADDGSHLLKIEGSFPGTNGTHSNFFVDDVSIEGPVPVELMNFSVD